MNKIEYILDTIKRLEADPEDIVSTKLNLRKELPLLGINPDRGVGQIRAELERQIDKRTFYIIYDLQKECYRDFTSDSKEELENAFIEYWWEISHDSEVESFFQREDAEDLLIRYCEDNNIKEDDFYGQRTYELIIGDLTNGELMERWGFEIRKLEEGVEYESCYR